MFNILEENKISNSKTPVNHHNSIIKDTNLSPIRSSKPVDFLSKPHENDLVKSNLTKTNENHEISSKPPITMKSNENNKGSNITPHGESNSINKPQTMQNSVTKNTENHENLVKTPNESHKLSLKSNENAENINKLQNNNTAGGSRLKKSEKVANLSNDIKVDNKLLSIDKKNISHNPVQNLNNFLNIKDFNCDSPGLNKNLLHEKNKKNSPGVIMPLENTEIHKKKSQRLFSISILEKVEELSKMEHVVPKE